MNIEVEHGVELRGAGSKEGTVSAEIRAGQESETLWDHLQEIRQAGGEAEMAGGVVWNNVRLTETDTGRPVYAADLTIGEGASERVMRAADALERAWQRAQAEQGSNDERLSVIDRYGRLSREIAEWRAFAETYVEPETGHDIIALMQALDGDDLEAEIEGEWDRPALSADELDRLM